MTTLITDTAAAVVNLRPGTHVVVQDEIHEVRHVEQMDTGYAVLLKRNGRVVCRSVGPDHVFQLASDAQVAFAQSEIARNRLTADLHMLIDLINAPGASMGVVPVTPETALFMDFGVATLGELETIAAYIGTVVETTYPSGQPRMYPEVLFPVARPEDHSAYPLRVRFYTHDQTTPEA